MYNVELAFRVGDASGYACRSCGRLLGIVYDDCKQSDSVFEEWNFCPFCATPLDIQLDGKE